jgi:hypothetical protein
MGSNRNFAPFTERSDGYGLSSKPWGTQIAHEDKEPLSALKKGKIYLVE